MTFPTRSTTALDSRTYEGLLSTLKRDIKRAPGKKETRFTTACQQAVMHLAHTTQFDGRTTNQITSLFTTFLGIVDVKHQSSKNASTLKNSHFLFSVSRNLAWDNQSRIFSVFGTIFELARQTHPEKWNRYDCDLLPLDDDEIAFENSSLFMITLFKHPPAPIVQRPVLTLLLADTTTRDGTVLEQATLAPSSLPSTATTRRDEPALDLGQRTLALLPSQQSETTTNETETASSSSNSQPVLEQAKLPPSSLLSTVTETDTNQVVDLTKDLYEVDEGPDPTPSDNQANICKYEEDYDLVGELSGESDFEDVPQQQPKVDTTQLNARLLQLALKGDDDTDSEEET